jgi:hypothetical protein
LAQSLVLRDRATKSEYGLSDENFERASVLLGRCQI